jgi:predicted flavoprotein YhiN
VETKTERGGRIFPVSDNAEDVVKAFKRYLADTKVQIKTGTGVNKILVENGCRSPVSGPAAKHTRRRP